MNFKAFAFFGLILITLTLNPVEKGCKETPISGVISDLRDQRAVCQKLYEDAQRQAQGWFFALQEIDKAILSAEKRQQDFIKRTESK